MVAADAGPMGIEWMGGSVWRWAGSARWSTTDGRGRGMVVAEASLLMMDDHEQQGEEIYCPRRHRRTQSAETPKTFVMSIVVSCGSGDRKRWRTELHFGGRESFDDHHGASTLRTTPKIFRTIGGRRALAGLRP